MASKTSTSSNGHSTIGHAVPPHLRSTTAGDIAAFLKAELVGDAKTLIAGVAGIDSAEPGAILFVENDRLLKTALDSSAAAIIAPSTSAAAVRQAGNHGGQTGAPAGQP